MWELLRASLISPARLRARWEACGRPAWALETAGAHGLGAYLLGVLAPLAPELAPEVGAARARGILRQRWQEAWLGELDQALAEEGIAAVVLKGPPLAEALYPAGQRTSLDLDLLVSPAQLDPALAALAKRGFHAESGPRSRYARASHHHLHLRRTGAPLVELHFKAFTGFGRELPAAPLLAAATQLKERRALARLDPAHELCYLGIHAAGHLFERALWLFDLALLSRSAGPREASWGEAAAFARRYALSQPLACAAQRLRELTGLATPDAPLLEPARARLASRLLRLDRAFVPGGSGQVLLRLAFQALLTEGSATRLAFLAHHAARIARRRLRRRLPQLAPPDWAG